MREYMQKRCSKRTSIKNEAGFSLIELAIVMVIIGLLTVPLLQRYNIYREQERLDYTTIAMNALNNALGDYYIAHGYYPLPADRAIAFGQTDHGKQVALSALTALSPGSCTSGNGACKVAGDPGFAYTGGIPYVDLGIPYSDMVDGYKNLISYSVSEDMADPARANDETRVGSITVNEVKVATGGASTTTAHENIYYALTSYGNNGAGSFNVNGLQVPCDSGLAEGENCDLDAELMHNRSKSFGNNSDYYDDYVQYVASSPAAIWALSEATPGGIYNTNAGPIGIGTKTPDPGADKKIKLDVVGDVKADNLRGQKYCDRDGLNCMLAEAIGGTGIITCAPGSYLTAVAQNTAICTSMALDVIPKTCGANQYVSAIDAGGNITCSNLP